MRPGPRTGVRWHNVYGNPEEWQRQGPVATGLTRWVSEHLMRPHPDLGRPGPVCPFVRHTAQRHLLWAGIADERDLSTTRMNAIVDDALDLYRRIRREHPDDARAATVVTVFPALSSYAIVDAVHAARKTEVVSEGSMLGQFYPGCTVPGLWHPGFRPLDAPYPMLVLRPMMSTDFPFLVSRSEWLYAYFTHLAPDLPRPLRWKIAERMRIDGPAAEMITALRAHSADEHAR